MVAILPLPELSLIAIALVLIILAAAIWALRQFIVDAFSHVPLIGGWIGSHLGAWLESAASALVHGAESSFNGAVRLFDFVAHWVSTMVDAFVHTMFELGVTINHLALVTVPALARDAERLALQAGTIARHWADHLYNEAVRYADGRVARAEQIASVFYHDALSYADAQAAAARHWADHLYNVAVRQADAAAAAVRADLLSLLSQAAADTVAAVTAARAYTLSLFQTAEADAARAVAAAEAQATSAIATAAGGIITDLDQLGNSVVADVWPDASGDLEALRQVLGDAFPDIQSLLRFLAGAGAAGLLGALTRALAGSAVATRALTDCVIPNCDNLSQLGKELSDLTSALSTAAMIAWLVYIAAEPVQAADDTVTVAAPLLDTLFTPLAALFTTVAEHL